MMQWTIPAKTFLLGEYAALHEVSALLVTTMPSFAISLTSKEPKETLHPQSPGGMWWHKQNTKETYIACMDPYQGQGGMGASSAQFIGSYLASCFLNHTKPCLEKLLQAYYLCAWNQKGLRPSGYDVIAQTQGGCVFINRQRQQLQSYPWPFTDLSFFLVHTGNKLATHQHLQQTALPPHTEILSEIVDTAHNAMEQKNSAAFIKCINQYHQQLQASQLVAPHSDKLIKALSNYSEVLAIKGCGALGSDVILIISATSQAASLKKKLTQKNYRLLATESDIAPPQQNLFSFL